MKKYLFIDTNIYKYLFNESSTFSDDVVDIIEKLLDNDELILLLPEQVKDEIERNHLEKWYIKEVNDREKKFENYKKGVEKKISDLIEFDKIINILNKEIKKEEKNRNSDLKKIKLRYRDKKSKAIDNFNKLKQKSTPIETTLDILDRSDIRNKKNNPPYDKDKLTDAIIWESLLYFIKTKHEEKNKPEKTEIYFIADDKIWGCQDFNPFLLNELLFINPKIKVIYRKGIQSLGDIFELDIKKVEKEENTIIKDNTINKFCESRSWENAGSNFRELLKYKNDLNFLDFEKIIKASISNSQIYNSWFVNLNALLEDEKNNGFVINIIESLKDDIWNIFKQKNNITLTRKKDQIENNQQNTA